jgi:hypothetical protein
MDEKGKGRPVGHLNFPGTYGRLTIFSLFLGGPRLRLHPTNYDWNSPDCESPMPLGQPNSSVLEV